MPSCRPSSPASAPCRLEWRPSRWLLAALLIVSVLAPLSVLGSELPRTLAWPLAAVTAARGLQLARREAGRAPCRLVLAAAAGGGDTLDGRPLARCEVDWRGPLAFVHAVHVDGRRQRLVWWPDTLPVAQRRELRLAAVARSTSRHDRPVAP